MFTYSVMMFLGVGIIMSQDGRLDRNPGFCNPRVSLASEKDASVMKWHCALQALDCISFGGVKHLEYHLGLHKPLSVSPRV